MKAVFGAYRRVGVLLLPVGLALFTAGLASGSVRAASNHQVTIYAVATQAQFVNYQDGITRAVGHNPFNADTAKLPPKQQTKKGEFPGNSAFFSFKLYTDANRTHPVGTATYTCSFSFNQVANCNAQYFLKDGSLFASGPVDFTGTGSTLAIVGGTSKYLGASGEVATSAIANGGTSTSKNESRLSLTLIG